jgi:catechol 2,3-dioxygenase-like lactoylglutathione lyase family enzyme
VESETRVLGLELIVDDIERATALFTEVLGFELYERGKFELFAGEMAVVTDGSIAITLLQPTTDGDQPVLPDRTPRLSQIVLAGRTDASEANRALIESGLSVTPTSQGFYLTPESVAGALGIETAIVVVSDDLEAGE